MSISSASTDAQVQAEVEDNASYLTDGSLTKCRAYVYALTVWMFRLSKRAKLEDDHGARIERELRTFQSELKNAREWLQANGGETDAAATQTSYADLSGFREL